jgi:hypothetical protein
VLKSGSSADHSGGSQGQTRPKSETLADGEAKPNAERNPEEVTTEHNRDPGAKIETRIEVGTSSRQPQNRIVQFPKPDHMVSAVPGQKQPSRTTVPGTAPTPCWCPPGLMPS